MARVAVVHNTLDFRGGADAVCMHVCQALQDDHDVTLCTVSATTLATLNDLFDTAVDVDVAGPPGSRPLASVLARVDDAVGPQLGARSALLTWWVRRHRNAFDLAVSTANEFTLGLPSVQYVHFPQFNAHVDGPEQAGTDGLGTHLWTALAGLADRELPADATLLANSEFTAAHVAARYGRRPDVLYPPVDPIEGRAWDRRHRGVLTVGRIAPDNRTLDAIRIVDAVRERGHDIDLRLVGSTPDAYRSYVCRVERAVGARPYVTLDRDLPRADLERLLGRYRYGLNPKHGEHFGMALAEYVASGMVAFAHGSGGQREVVAGDPDRLYTTVEECAAKLSRAIATDARPTLPRDRFASDRFADAVRERVDTVLAESDGTDD